MKVTILDYGDSSKSKITFDKREYKVNYMQMILSYKILGSLKKAKCNSFPMYDISVYELDTTTKETTAYLLEMTLLDYRI